jgi:hypothetical protein
MGLSFGLGPSTEKVDTACRSVRRFGHVGATSFVTASNETDTKLVAQTKIITGATSFGWMDIRGREVRLLADHQFRR